MSTKMKFLWIDDEQSRAHFAKDIEEKYNIKVRFEWVGKQNIADSDIYIKLVKIINSYTSNKTKPDLVIIDHFLNKTKGEYLKKGSEVAEILRTEWPQCPILGISAVDEKATILEKKYSYEELYSIDGFASKYESLIVIAKTFKSLSEKSPTNRKQIVDRLIPPEQERERILSVLPDDLKQNFNDKSLLSRISRWVRHTFLDNPGFLYDDLWASTIVGVKHSSFHKVENILNQAKYKGIFADESSPRWWNAIIKEILFKKYGESDNKQTWELARKIQELSAKDYSVCYVCREEFPEIVGFTDETATKREQMHLRCSVPHLDYKRNLYFEEMRMVKGEDES